MSHDNGDGAGGGGDGATQELPNLVVCTKDKRARMTALVKAYFAQLKDGCGRAACENTHCKSSPRYVHGEKDAMALYQEAKTLTRAAFREPQGVFYFCSTYCYPLSVIGARIAPLSDFAYLLDSPAATVVQDAEFFKETLECLDSAPFFLYDIDLMRAGGDRYVAEDDGASEGGSSGAAAPPPALRALADVRHTDSGDATPNGVGGCFLGADIPRSRKVLRALAEVPAFQEALGALARGLAAATKAQFASSEKKGGEGEGGGSGASAAAAAAAAAGQEGTWRDTLERELATLHSPEEMQRMDPRKGLNTFLTLRLTRLFLLLLECPLVLHDAAVLADVCTALGRMHKYLTPPLVAVFSQYAAEDLEPIVQSLQTFITLTLLQDEQLLRSDVRFETHIPAACVVLSILCEANYTLQPTGILSQAKFYNEGINENIDAKLDFEERFKAENEGASLTAVLMHNLSKEEKMANHTLQQTLLLSSQVMRRECDGLPARFAVSQFPFLLDAAFKHALLQHHSMFQQQNEIRMSLISQRSFPLQLSPEAVFLVLRIDREDLLNTTLRELNRNKEKVRRPLRVEFKGEEGIDEGGVKKEFFQMLVRKLLDPSFGMFTEDTETNVHWFQPRIVCSTNDIEYNLIGKIFGLAIYNQVILDINFPPVCFKKLLHIEATFDDLKDLDVVLHRNLQKLLDYDEAKEGATVQDVFCHSFVVSHEVFGEVIDVELKPGGADIDVTVDNRSEYVELYTQYLCTQSLGKNFQEFRDGFYEVCGRQAELLRLFHPDELESMVVGSPIIDLGELEQSTAYDGYAATDPMIVEFWKVIKAMTMEEQAMFLKFCTGTDRLPIRGLKSLNFVVGKNGGDSEQLPTAHTCFNHLLIPEYADVARLKEKLSLAIRNCHGFGLM